ncbi:ras-related protein Rab-2-A-like [Oryza glaberrima]|uniref:Uncharacterized protein n=1 Tax=Oryza glaberrima TaxID=4538 RepID=I1NZV5_ORYGL|nr:ras-related protein Rab-2-A [Oryza sativa Japonica Group]XP_052142985.1 ras-related protein Rab-2-A-like [Oryza glaberrima]
MELNYAWHQGDTFDHLTTWIEEARRLGVGGAKLTICFIGNKCDLSDRRAVSYEEGEQFAKQNALLFIEASAKAAHNVNEAFTLTARAMCHKVEDAWVCLMRKFDP